MDHCKSCQGTGKVRSKRLRGLPLKCPACRRLNPEASWRQLEGVDPDCLICKGKGSLPPPPRYDPCRECIIEVELTEEEQEALERKKEDRRERRRARKKALKKKKKK